MFELADVWCPHIDGQEYADFLDNLFNVLIQHCRNIHSFPYFTTIWRRRRPNYSEMHKEYTQNDPHNRDQCMAYQLWSRQDLRSLKNSKTYIQKSNQKQHDK